MKNAVEWQKELGVTGIVWKTDIERIQQDARNSALAEAAESISDWAKAWRGAHMNTNDVCGILKRDVLSLADAAPQPKN